MKIEWESHNSGYQATSGELTLEYGPTPLMDTEGNGWWTASTKGRIVGRGIAMRSAEVGRKAAEQFAHNFNTTP